MAENDTYEQALNQIEGMTKAIGVSQSLNNLEDSAEKAKSGLEGFEKAVLGSVNKINSLETVTNAQTKQFGLVTTAILGASESFKTLGGNALTIGDQFKNVNDQLSGGKGILANLINLSGSPQVAQGMKKMIDTFKDMTEETIKGADNALRLRAGYMSLAASTGDLGDVYKTAGDDLGNINDVISKQAQIMANAAGATNLPISTMEHYYAALGQIPGALKSVVKGGEDAAKSFDMLTATTRLAHGTGRDFKDIVNDLSEAYKNYGIKGEEALNFTSRFSEISNKFGIQLSSVKSALSVVAIEMGKYVDAISGGNKMAEGSAAIMNNYMGALTATGITGERAAGIIGNMTKHMGELNIAQKSFLSAQSGGPGGLMGGFQIEKMLREGNIEGVFEKAKQTMQKQFGSIVSLDEASKSEASAAQFQKQILMLRQGPLGSFAQTDQDAMRILEGFKKGTAVAPPDKLKETGLQENMTKGLNYQKQSATALVAIQNLIEKFKLSAGFSSLEAMQASGLTAGAGTQSAFSEAAQASRKQISERLDISASRAGKIAKGDAKGDVKSGVVENLKDFKEIVAGMPTSITAIKEMATIMLGVNVTVDKLQEQRKIYIEQAAKRKREMEAAGDVAGVKKLDITSKAIIKRVDAKINEAMKSVPKGTDPSKVLLNKISTSDSTIKPAIARAGMKVDPGQASVTSPVVVAASAASTKSTSSPTGVSAVMAKGAKIPAVIELKGKIEGFCIKCKQAVTDAHVTATSVGAEQ